MKTPKTILTAISSTVRGGDFMADKAAHVRAVAKYDKTHTKGLYLKFNLVNDADILAKLDAVGNKQLYIKNLIRADIGK